MFARSALTGAWCKWLCKSVGHVERSMCWHVRSCAGGCGIIPSDIGCAVGIYFSFAVVFYHFVARCVLKIRLMGRRHTVQGHVIILKKGDVILVFFAVGGENDTGNLKLFAVVGVGITAPYILKKNLIFCALL